MFASFLPHRYFDPWQRSRWPGPRQSDVAGGDPIEAETLVVALSHDAHLMWGRLPKGGAGEPALGDREMVLGGIGPRDAWFWNTYIRKIYIWQLIKHYMKYYSRDSFLSSIYFFGRHLRKVIAASVTVALPLAASGLFSGPYRQGHLLGTALI